MAAATTAASNHTTVARAASRRQRRSSTVTPPIQRHCTRKAEAPAAARGLHSQLRRAVDTRRIIQMVVSGGRAAATRPRWMDRVVCSNVGTAISRLARLYRLLRQSRDAHAQPRQLCHVASTHGGAGGQSQLLEAKLLSSYRVRLTAGRRQRRGRRRRQRHTANTACQQGGGEPTGQAVTPDERPHRSPLNTSPPGKVYNKDGFGVRNNSDFLGKYLWMFD